MSTPAGSVAKMMWGGATPVPGAAAAPTESGLLFGVQSDMTQKDMGDGRYEVFDPTGQSLGYSYKDVLGATSDLSFQNASKNTVGEGAAWTNPLLTTAREAWTTSRSSITGTSGQEWEPEEIKKYWAKRQQVASDSMPGDFAPSKYDSLPDGSVPGLNEDGTPAIEQTTKYDPTTFASREELDKALRSASAVKGGYGSTMGQWEALGQVVNGGIAPNEQEWGNLPSNNQVENITGANALYGSKPVFSKGEDGKYELAGYQMDLTPNVGSNFQNGSDSILNYGNSTVITHKGKNHSWSNSVWRELNDPEAWGKAAVVGSDGTAFIPKDAVDTIPGWKNKDSYNHEDIKHGLVEQIWYATSPTHSVTGLEWKDVAPVAEVVGNIVGMIFTGYPIGSLVMTVDSASAGDSKAALGHLVSAAATYAAAQVGTGGEAAVETATSTTGTAANGMAGSAAGSTLGQVAGQSAVNAAASGLGTYAVTGDSAAALKAALGGAIAGAAGAYFSGANMSLKELTGFSTEVPGLDKIIMKAGMGAAKAAISAGATGAEVGDAFSRAGQAAVASLLGSGVTSATGSSLAGTAASTVTSGLLRGATTDQPDSTGKTPAAPAPAPSSPTSYTGSVARMQWRS